MKRGNVLFESEFAASVLTFRCWTTLSESLLDLPSNFPLRLFGSGLRNVSRLQSIELFLPSSRIPICLRANYHISSLFPQQISEPLGIQHQSIHNNIIFDWRADGMRGEFKQRIVRENETRRADRSFFLSYPSSFCNNHSIRLLQSFSSEKKILPTTRSQQTPKPS